MRYNWQVLSFFILLNVIPPIYCFSQEWEWQNPLPQGNDITCIDFVGGNNGWLGCYGGILLHTLDGGQTWEVQSTANNRLWINDIDFIDLMHGWIVGSNGIVARTLDGGDSWQVDTLKRYYSGEKPDDLNSVMFISHDYGWACGDLGTIFHTKDGGNTWVEQEIPISTWKMQVQDYYNICFVDTLKGWAIGRDAFLWTEDGGEHWQMDTTIVSQYSINPNECVWIDMGFWDENQGWVLSTTGVFLKTEDGGSSWQEICVGGFEDIATDGFFPDPQHGWIVSRDSDHGPYPGIKNGIFYTEDGGTTWEKLTTDPELTKLQFFDELSGIGITGSILSMLKSSYRLYSTDDGGYTWQCQSNSISEEPIHFRSVQAINKETCFVVGYYTSYKSGKIFKTTDGGKTWISQYSGNLTRFFDVYFATSDSGWVVGPKWKILFTYDGGSHWVEQNSNCSLELHAVDFANSRYGWAAGGHYFDGGVIVHTSDGGTNWDIQWQEQVVGRSEVYDIDFVDSLYGWAVTSGGGILHTIDGGNNWYYQGKIYVGVIRFLDRLHGWGIGGSGVYKTTDGGETWVHCSSGDHENDFMDIYFIDTIKGWASGYFGALAYTSDAGKTWIQQDSKTKNYLRGISFGDSSNGWAVGSWGTIIHLTDSSQTYVESAPIDQNRHRAFYLQQNFPNPFNSRTVIKYQLMSQSHVLLSIYNLIGKEVITLVDELKSGGQHQVVWNGKDQEGGDVSSGIYFYSLRVNSTLTVVKKVICLR